MSDYKTIVVGTDGSKSSLLAVERAASIAAAFDATLVIGCAYYETAEDLSLIHISEPTRHFKRSRMPSSA